MTSELGSSRRAYRAYRELEHRAMKRVSGFVRPLDSGLPRPHDGRKILVCSDRSGPVAAAVVHPVFSWGGKRVTFFSSVVADERPDALANLAEIVESAARAEGSELVVGPMAPTLGVPRGVPSTSLHGRPPLFGMPNAVPGLGFALRSAGFEVHDDLYHFTFSADADFSKLKSLALALAKTSDVTLDSFDMSRIEAEIASIVGLYNECYRDNFGFIELNAKEFWEENRGLAAVYAGEFGAIARRNGRPIAFMMSIPDYNEILALNGRLPTWIRMLDVALRWKRVRSVRGMFIAVPPRERGRGLDVRLLAHVLTSIEGRVNDPQFHVAWVSGRNISWINQIQHMSATGAPSSNSFEIYRKELV